MPEFVSIRFSNTEYLFTHLQHSSPPLSPRLLALRNSLEGQLRASPGLPPASPSPVSGSTYSDPETTVVGYPSPTQDQGSVEALEEGNLGEDFSDEAGQLILELLEESGLNDKFAQVSTLRN